MADLDLIDRFERLEIPAPEFRHIDHLRVAYEMLDRYDFLEACARYGRTIRAMAESVGAADKFNVTITLAFMSLLAEHKDGSTAAGFDAFIDDNPQLMDRRLLLRWYSSARLDSAAARTQFLLPERAEAA